VGTLEGQTSVITGAAQGLGLATAAVFAREGARLCLFDVDAQRLADAEARLAAAGALPASWVVDITDPVAVASAVEQCGPVDILVNNAAVHELRGIDELAPDAFERMLSVNVLGTYNCTKTVLQNMVRQRTGSIVSVASIAGLRGHPIDDQHHGGASHYAASKGAVIAFTRSIAREVAHLGIRANCVAPGMMATPMNKAAYRTDGVDEYARTIPLGRIGDPAEIAEAIAFLASPRASYITGQVLNVDGGVLMA
jgi:3-oxoacyl-[acyl-carrier protein] reductase